MSVSARVSACLLASLVVRACVCRWPCRCPYGSVSVCINGCLLFVNMVLHAENLYIQSSLLIFLFEYICTITFKCVWVCARVYVQVCVVVSVGVRVCRCLYLYIQDVDGAKIFGLFMFLRIGRVLAEYVTDNSFIEQGVNQRRRQATEAGASAWAHPWRDVWREVDVWRGVWATTFVCARLRRTPLPMRCGLVSSLLASGLALTWLTRLACWWFWSTVPRPSALRRGTRPIWPSPAGLTGLLVLVLRDSVWTLMRPGFLASECEAA